MPFLNAIVSIFIEMAPYLLLGISFVALLNLFVSKDFVVKHTGKNNFASVVKSALLGVPLPLCSCGVIPTSVYLSKSGASKPAVISFLISTPQTGIDSIVATYGMLGPIFAIFRPIAAFVMGILGGVVDMFVSKGKNQNHANLTKNLNFEIEEYASISANSNFLARVVNSVQYAFVDFIDDISIQFFLGLLVAGAIAFFVPDDFFTKYFEGNDLLAMFAVLLLGIPMYVCATASIPVAVTLMMKGFSPGVAYVFLVSGPVSNAASIAILYKTLGKKSLLVYIGIVTFTALVFGFILNGIFSIIGINPQTQILHIHSHKMDVSLMQYLSSAFLLLLLISSYYRKFVHNFFVKSGTKMNGRKFKVEGMTCNHCVMNVTKAIRNVPGVRDVKVDLTEGSVFIEGEFLSESVRDAVESIGYTFKGEM
ncbi:MAG: SO_0444 family Cu/Zn efflux transporter [Candidatus Kapaibacteriales bacterium]